MIPWYWLPIVLIIGACMGYMACGFLTANDEPRRKKWWEDDKI